MRVYIGPYRDRWISKIHERYMNRKYDYNWPKTQTWFENFLEKIEDGFQWVYNNTINLYLDKKERKIKVKIDPQDTWSMDSTLAHIILPMLKQLKETKHGSPFIDDEDVPEELRSTNAPPKKHKWDIDDNHHARWEYVLGRMIWSFEQIIRDDRETQFYSGNSDLLFVDDEETNMKRLELGPNDTFKVDTEAQKIYEHKIQEGLNLFSKYYFSLWD